VHKLLERIAANRRRNPATLRLIREEAGPVQPGREKFGQLAAEFGVRQYEAVHGWALWAIEQLDAAQARAAGSVTST
jgi:hypothetical protein